MKALAWNLKVDGFLYGKTWELEFFHGGICLKMGKKWHRLLTVVCFENVLDLFFFWVNDIGFLCFFFFGGGENGRIFKNGIKVDFGDSTTTKRSDLDIYLEP